METGQFMERYTERWSEDSVRLILTPGSFTKATYFYAQEAGYFRTDDEYFTERQNLNSFLIVFTLSGKGMLRYQGKTYIADEGSCFFIDCVEHHYYQTMKSQHWDLLWLHFYGRSALGYYEEFKKGGNVLLHPGDREKIIRAMREILILNQKKNVTTDVKTSCLITEILTDLLLETMTESSKELQIPPYMKKVLERLDHNFRERQSLDELSRFVGVSKYHLSHEFKRYTGTTINEYLILARLSYAKELLKYSELSVSEIANAAGIPNSSHFINLFKAREGVTPLAYRKEWGNV